MKVYDTTGKLVISDVWLQTNIDNLTLYNLIEESIKLSGMTIMNKKEQKFEPYDGVTTIWILSESHFSLHTYPEHNYISMDCYTCGELANPELAIKYILDGLKIRKYKTQIITRGDYEN